MKPCLKKAAAHLAIGAAAFFLVSGTIKSGAAGNSDSSKAERKAEAEKRLGPAREAATTKSHMKPAEYQVAWDAVAGKRWSRAERVEYQIRLLKEWAESDLEGALKAAFSETWRPGDSGIHGETLDRAFAEVFVDRSEDVWKLIQQRKMGILESSVLLEAWSTALLSKNPEVYLGYLKDMNEGDFAKAFGMAAGNSHNKAVLTKLMDVLAEKAKGGASVDGLDRSFLGAATRTFSKAELMEKLSSSPESMNGFYTSLLAMNFAASSRTATVDQVAAEIDSLPEDKRGPFARALLTSYSGNPVLLRTALDRLVASGQWQLLDKQETSNAVSTMSRGTEPVDLAEWAVNLPPRDETSEMFHRGVQPYIQKNREDAWNWIEKMDAGYWRDHALAEYSQVNLHVFNDPAKSATAIEQIADPAFRKMVQGWRSDWEIQKPK